MNKTPLVLLAVAALALGAQDLSAQSPTPTPCPSATPNPPCPAGFGWAEGLAQYTAYPAPLFPTEDTANLDAQDCLFHQWSWEAFVWATAIGPDGRARFATLRNIDELGKKALPARGPKPLSLKPRDLKPPGPRQNSGDEPQQAGGGIVVDKNGQILWYSTHMNDAYFTFLQQYGGAGYAQAPISLDFPVGAAVFKASWQVVPDGTAPAGFYIEKTTVPLLVNKQGGGIGVDKSGKTRPVTVALVGLHVVGVTANHPEFLWATFEQSQNAPDLPVGMASNSTDPVSNQSFTFYAANTPANGCNVTLKPTDLKVTDPIKQTVAPVTNIFRQYSTGGADCARTLDIIAVNTAAQGEMTSLGTANPPQPKETVWANYKLIGTLWLQACTLQPGVSQLEKQGIASIDLANSTLETFFQGPEHNFNGNAMANCFMCHNTGGSRPKAKIPYAGKNINLSHALLGTIPAPTPSPTPPPTPTPTPAAKRPQ